MRLHVGDNKYCRFWAIIYWLQVDRYWWDDLIILCQMKNTSFDDPFTVLYTLRSKQVPSEVPPKRYTPSEAKPKRSSSCVVCASSCRRRHLFRIRSAELRSKSKKSKSSSEVVTINKTENTWFIPEQEELHYQTSSVSLKPVRKPITAAISLLPDHVQEESDP